MKVSGVDLMEKTYDRAERNWENRQKRQFENSDNTQIGICLNFRIFRRPTNH